MMIFLDLILMFSPLC